MVVAMIPAAAPSSPASTPPPPKRRNPAFDFAVIAVLIGMTVLGTWPLYRLFRSVYRDMIGSEMLQYRIDVEHRFDQKQTPAAAIAQTVETVKARLKEIEPFAQVGENEGILVVMLFGIGHDQARAAAIERQLARSARIEFEIVDDGSDFMRQLAGRKDLGQLQAHDDAWAEHEDKQELHRDRYLWAADEGTLQSELARLAPQLPGEHQLLLGPLDSGSDDQQHRWRTYYVRDRVELGNGDIATVEQMWDQPTGRPELSVVFTDAGSKRFAELTGAFTGRKMAIVVEGRVQTAPVIESRVEGGKARISLGGSKDLKQLGEEAKGLCTTLRGGTLAAPLVLLRMGPRKAENP
jgi:preprotein translocase subunit SecD